MAYCRARQRRDRRDWAVACYVAESLRLAPEGKALGRPVWEVVDESEKRGVRSHATPASYDSILGHFRARGLVE